MQKIIGFLLLTLVPAFAGAVEKVWTGSVSTDWATAGNWSPSGVPASGDDVKIRANVSRYPVISSSVTIRDLIVNEWYGSGSSITINSGASVNVTRSFQVLGSAAFTQNGGSFNHSGTSLTISSDAVFNINGGTFGSSASPFVSAGSFTAGTATLNFNGGLTVASGKTFTNNNTQVNITGNLILANSSGNFYAGKDSIIVSGRLDIGNNCNFYGDTAYILIGGNGTNSISGNLHVRNAYMHFDVVSFTDIGSGGRVYVNTGEILFSDSLYIGSNGQLDGDDGKVTFTKSLTVSSNGVVGTDNGILNFEGNATFRSTGTLNAGSGTVNFGGNVTVSNSGTINNTSGDINIEGNVSFSNTGTLNAGSGNITVGGDVTLNNNGGTINAQTSTISIGGDFTNLGSFNADSSTVVFNGDSTQQIATNVVFFNLVIETDGQLVAGGNVTVLNGGTIGSNTTIVIPDANDQFNVQGDLQDESGSLAVATNKPFVTDVIINSSTQIVVIFNESVTVASSQTNGNYSMSGFTISGATRIDSNKVRLTLSPAMSQNVEYTLVLNNIVNMRSPAGTMSPNHQKRFTWEVFYAPTTSASAITFSNIGYDTMTVSWTNGNGTGRILVGRAGSAVTFTPADLVQYAQNALFGAGANLGSNQYVLYRGSGNSVKISGLTQGTVYHFAVYEFNGTGSKTVYKTSTPATGNQSTRAPQPTVSASNFTVLSSTGSSATVRVNKGNGAGRLVLIKSGSAVDASPVDGTAYAAAANFGSAPVVSGTVRAVYLGSDSVFTITGLSTGVTYHFAVYEYSGSGSVIDYKTTTPATGSATTGASEPTVAASAVQFRSVGANGFTVRWTNGNGSSRVVIARAGSAVSAVPADAAAYTANALFGSGQQISTGQFVVYNGTADSVVLTGLNQNTRYYFAVYEYNGTGGGINYLATAATGNQHTWLKARVKVFLEGVYASGDSMNAAVNGILPLNNPYLEEPWYFSSATDVLPSIPSAAVVDWVMVELRKANSASVADSSVRVSRQAGLLMRNGEIRALDGVSDLTVQTASEGRMFVVIYHRNHLPVMSSDSLVNTGSLFTYDFTTAANKAYGTNVVEDLGNGKFGMAAGRVENTTPWIIDGNDRIETWNFRNAIGYYLMDVNLDGIVDALDRSIVYNNMGMSVQIP